MTPSIQSTKFPFIMLACIQEREEKQREAQAKKQVRTVETAPFSEFWCSLWHPGYSALRISDHSSLFVVQEEAQKRQEEAEMRKRINDVLSEMQNDARDAALEVREQASQLRTAERTGASATRAGTAAARQLEVAEAAFSKAEGQLADANDVFNDLAGAVHDSSVFVYFYSI